MTMVVLVGEAPGPSGEVWQGRSRALLEQASGLGERLWELAAPVNLLARWPGREGRGSAFPLPEAAASALALGPWLLRRGEAWLCGRRVARAFGLPDGIPYFEETLALGVPAYLIPSPSGLNRWWNSKKNKESFGDFCGWRDRQANLAQPQRRFSLVHEDRFMTRRDCLPGGFNAARPCAISRCTMWLAGGACALDYADEGEQLPAAVARLCGETVELSEMLVSAALLKVRASAVGER